MIQTAYVFGDVKADFSGDCKVKVGDSYEHGSLKGRVIKVFDPERNDNPTIDTIKDCGYLCAWRQRVRIDTAG